jgi:hypothetical protein
LPKLSKNFSKIDKLYEHPATQSSPAIGEFVGSSWDNTKSPRAEAKRAYRAVLGRTAETETRDRGGQYDQRTGVQPEEVRVTDEPVPETGGAKSGRGSESQPAGSVASLKLVGQICHGVSAVGLDHNQSAASPESL